MGENTVGLVDVLADKFHLMPSPRADPIAPNVDVLDVRLLDLFAQVEAMLRCARDVQRHMITLRGTSARISNAQHRALATKIRKAVRQIQQESAELRSVVRNIMNAADELHASNDRKTRSRRRKHLSAGA